MKSLSLPDFTRTIIVLEKASGTITSQEKVLHWQVNVAVVKVCVDKVNYFTSVHTAGPCNRLLVDSTKKLDR